MREIQKVGVGQIAYLLIGAIIMIAVPVVIGIFWTVKKKEKFTTVLVGAGTFLLFALILEKPIQNVLLFPAVMGLPEHPVSSAINARPLLLAFLAGLFPGVFEETGRFAAFKTVLKKRKNRETSISYGIGHGGIEVVLIPGLSYITYLMYALMINTGTFDTVIQQAIEQVPDRVDALYTLADQIATYSFGNLLISIVERIFAVLYHIGASVLVFYACKDNRKLWLYPLAILLHTLLDFLAALYSFGQISLSQWALEGVVGVFGILTFFGAFLLLYKKDNTP